VRNIKFGTLGLILSYISGFIARKIFVMFLSIEYLGLSGVVSNFLTMLSLAELGFGAAISYSLYKPLAFGETYKIQALMKLYRKAYRIIGALVLLMGFAFTPFLHMLMNEVPDIPHLYSIYWLYVINSGSSYFLGYKRAVIVADQKSYINSIYMYGFQILKHALQIVILILTRNYILFLVVLLACTVGENLAITVRVNALYPYLKEKTDASLTRDEKGKIKRNIFALTFHKIGGVLVNGTDNIILVRFVNLASAGLYANYTLLQGSVGGIVGLIYSSITASIGNLSAERGSEGSKALFDELNFISAWIYGFTALCLYFLCNPFISLWLGRAYLFPKSVVFVIVFNYYLTGMRRPVLAFKDSLGLFWYDRYKALLQAGINLVVSVLLARKYGVIGVLIGSSASTLATCFWIEPYVVFRFGFDKPLARYFFQYLGYTGVTLVAGLATFACLSLITLPNTIIRFTVSLLAVIIVPNLVYLLFFHRLSLFRETLAILKRMEKSGKKG
jgi:O-antigen/teichoic acid export membrane protein